MATNNLRGDGLVRALTALEENPQRLDRARWHFMDSPPPYTSPQSHNSTQYTSPNPPSEEQGPGRWLHIRVPNPPGEEQEREERRWQPIREREQSLPRNQFYHQTIKLLNDNLMKADENGEFKFPPGMDPERSYRSYARDVVKARWVEQGIWNDKWEYRPDGRWKHEEPLELESESETETEMGPFGRPPLFAPRKSDEEKRQIAERREREREASRPFHQFVYQVSKERERIQNDETSEEVMAGATIPADINTRAYENVKKTWIKRRIWNKNWGILPGMSWKHEEPLEEVVDDFVPINVNPLGNESHDVGEALRARLFGSPLPIETNHRRVSPQGQFAGEAPRAHLFRSPPPVGTNHRQVSPQGQFAGEAPRARLFSSPPPVETSHR